MNRRELLRAIALSAAMLPVGALAAVPNTPHTGLMYCTNKIGLPCAFSKEIAQDMMKVHRINIVELFSRKYGTTFTISKKVLSFAHKEALNLDGTRLLFTLTTNDERDIPKSWIIRV